MDQMNQKDDSASIRYTIYNGLIIGIVVKPQNQATNQDKLPEKKYPISLLPTVQ